MSVLFVARLIHSTLGPMERPGLENKEEVDTGKWRRASGVIGCPQPLANCGAVGHRLGRRVQMTADAAARFPLDMTP